MKTYTKKEAEELTLKNIKENKKTLIVSDSTSLNIENDLVSHYNVNTMNLVHLCNIYDSVIIIDINEEDGDEEKIHKALFAKTRERKG